MCGLQGGAHRSLDAQEQPVLQVLHQGCQAVHLVNVKLPDPACHAHIFSSPSHAQEAPANLRVLWHLLLCSAVVHMMPTGSDAEGRGSTRGPRNGGGGGSCSHALHHTHAYVQTFDARALTRQSFTGRWHLADPRAAGCMATMRAYAGMAAARTRGAFKQHACSLVGTMRKVALANGQPWTRGDPCRRLVATFRLVALARKASLVVTPMWSRKYGSLCVHIST